MQLEDSANAAGAALASRPGSPVEVRVIPTDEEAMIARHARTVLAGAAGQEDTA